MVAVFAFVDAKMRRNMVIVLGDASGELGFFTGGVTNFVLVANPTARGFVDSLI